MSDFIGLSPESNFSGTESIDEYFTTEEEMIEEDAEDLVEGTNVDGR